MSRTWIGSTRRLADTVRHAAPPRLVAALGLWLRTRVRRQSPLDRLRTLAQAAHVCPTGSTFRGLCAELRTALERLAPEEIDWSRVGKQPADAADVPKGILLKPCVGPDEKGVLHVPFEDQWLRLFRSGRAAAIAEKYDLILGPSWSPPPDLALLLALKLWPGRLYTLLSNHADAERMRELSPTLTPIPLLSSSWVDPAAFAPHLGQERDLDVVMLANFAPFKRHWLLFEALRSLPASYRVLLMGVPMEGRTEEHLRREAAHFGVADRFEVLVRPTREQVARNLARAKVSLVLSRREGSCVAVTESLFANTPVGLVRGCHIGSRMFLNHWTGRLLREHRLAEDIRSFVEMAGTYRPRAWALSHITYKHSTALLNATLREAAQRDGRPWTRDIEAITKDTVSTYPDAEAAREMQPHIDAFERDFGLRLGRGVRKNTDALVAVA